MGDLGADVDAYASSSPADLTRAAAEASRGDYDRVIVCGGDGTLNLAVREFDLANGTLDVSIADRQGNITRIERRFHVKEQKP